MMDSRTSPKPGRSPSPSTLMHGADPTNRRRSPSPSLSTTSRASTQISSNHVLVDQSMQDTSSVAGSTSSSRLASPSPTRRGVSSPDDSRLSHRRNTSSNASVISLSSSVAHSEGYVTARRNHRSISSNASAHSFSSSVTPTTRSNHYYMHSSSSASSGDIPRAIPRTSRSHGDGRKTYADSSLRFNIGASSIDECDSPKSSGSKSSRRRDYSLSTEHSVKRVQSEASIAEETSRIQKTIDQLRTARGHPQRLNVIAHALQDFDHGNMHRHNLELKLKAPETLSHLLFESGKNDDEIRMICSALEMVYRGSTSAVKISFLEAGKLMIPEWLKLSEKYEENNRLNRTVKASVVSITRIFLYFSRVPDLRQILAQQPGVLAMLNRVSSKALHGQGMEQCREDRMKVLANLCNCNTNKSLIFENSSLMNSLHKVAFQDESVHVREYAAACLMDLSSSETIQVPMANSNNIVQALLKLSRKNESDSTREYAVTAIQNICFQRENRIQIINFESGVFLGLLTTIMMSDRSKVTRRRAAGALTNLACSNTASRMANYPHLMESTAKVCALDPCPEVQHRACRALTKISCHIDSSMQCYMTVLDSLIRAASSSNATGIPMVLRMMSRQPSNRAIMGQQPGMMELLSSIASSKAHSESERESCIKVIAHIANESSCRKSLCNKWILGALVSAAQWEEPDNFIVNPASELMDILKSTRDAALLAIERLAMEMSNRPFMARHKDLLVVVAKATERESKLNSLDDSIQPKLAKALLMSLIIAL